MKTSINNEEEDLGVCRACGGIKIQRIKVNEFPDYLKDREFNARECLECGEIWGGLYRSALKGRKKSNGD